jgi:anionic cell wall polymer biosynthesis LytR-Cps2A-Psr (LCP) family protein
VSPARKRPKDPLWARLTVVFGALVMFGSMLTVAVPKVLASIIRSNIEEFDTIPETLQGDNIDGAINFLLLGIDERKDGPMAGELIRADSIVLVHVPASHDRAYMISFPRDLRVQIPPMAESGYNGDFDKLAHAFAFGSMDHWQPDTSKAGKERGVALTLQTISNMVPGGLRFHGTAMIDFEGFDAVVHALGSVYMCIDQDVWSIHYWPDGTPAGNPLWGGLTDEPADGPYKSGFHYKKDWCGDLEPWQALDYSRQRYGLENTDYDRQRHQQQLLKAIVKKIAKPDTLANFRTVLALQEAAGDLLTLDLNDIPLEDWVITLSSLRPDDLIMIETYGGTFRTENVEENGVLVSYQRLDQDLVQLLQAVQTDTVMDFLLQHPDWVAPPI